jgi:hypothetical protein
MMAEGQYCPNCYRRIEGLETRCQVCGFALAGHKPEGLPTENIPTDRTGSDPLLQTCHEIVENLPAGSLALLFEERKEPVIIPDARVLILGRSDVKMDEGYVNLMDFSDMVMAVSRRHCRIALVDGRYTLEDIGSTNGTWLNRRRLATGVVYPLLKGDRIWIGPLKLTICFQDERTAVTELFQQVGIFLRPRVSDEGVAIQLTPQFLLQQIGPFLQAISELEQILQKCQNLTAPAVTILAVQHEANAIFVRLVGAETAIKVIQEAVNPWCEKNLDITGSSATNLTGRLLTDPIQLAEEVVKSLSLEFSQEEAASGAKSFLPVLRTIVASPLKLAEVKPLAS